MNDPINRADAIKHLKKRLYETALNSNTEHPYYEEIADNRIDVWMNELPSAQPEIIRCKDCKNSEHWYRDRRRCFLWSEDGVSVWDSGFCNYAERRTDDER